MLGPVGDIIKLVMLIVQALFQIHEEKRAAEISGEAEVDRRTDEVKKLTANDILNATTPDDIALAFERARKQLRGTDDPAGTPGAPGGVTDGGGEGGDPPVGG